MASGSSGNTPTPPTRKKDFQMFEDLAIAQAWQEISGDPCIGTNQNRRNFWLRIWEMFEVLCPTHLSRNVSTITARWNNIVKPRVIAYVGCQRQAYKAMASGENHQDVIRNAGKMYQLQFKHAFAFDPILEVLQANNPSFNYLIEESQSEGSVPMDANIFSAGSESSPSEGPSASQRPNVGKKKAKEQKRKGAMQTAETRWEAVNNRSEGVREECANTRAFVQAYGESIKEKADQMLEYRKLEIEQLNSNMAAKLETQRAKQAMLQATQEKVEVEKRAIEDGIMFHDERNLTPFQLDYLKARQFEIAQKRNLRDPRMYD